MIELTRGSQTQSVGPIASRGTRSKVGHLIGSMAHIKSGCLSFMSLIMVE